MALLMLLLIPRAEAVHPAPAPIDTEFREADVLKHFAGGGSSLRAEASGDFDSDGFDDVVLAHPDETFSVFAGSATGPVTPAAQTILGPTGAWTLTTGDVDGDGYDDLIVGAPNHDDATDDGCVQVFRGSASGLETTPSWSFYGFDWALHYANQLAIGDVDGDGFDDIVLTSRKANVDGSRVFVHRGSGTGPEVDPSVDLSFDTNILAITVADLDGDLYDDLVVGEPQSPDEAVLVFAGSSAGTPTTPTWTIDPDPSIVDGGFGEALDAGDVDGDGSADLIIAAPDAASTGAVFVHLGTATGPTAMASFRIDGMRRGSLLGYRGVLAHDLDGDGFDDLVLTGSASTVDKDGADDFARETWIQVHYGAPSGPEPTPAWVARAANTGDLGLDGMGDVDGDGHGDLVLAIHDSGSHSTVQVHLGGADRTRGTMAPTWWSTIKNYGAAMEGAGDVNGDGYDDLLVAAPSSRVGGSDWRATEDQPALVGLHLGSPSGLTPTSAWSPDDPTGDVHASFGFDIAYAGDVNGDGYDDVVVSAPEADAPVFLEEDHGAVFVYYGSASGLPDVPNATFYGDKEWERFGMDVAGAGDIDGDGFDDIVVGSPEHMHVNDILGEVTTFFGAAAGLGAGAPPVQLRGTADQGLGSGLWIGDIDGDALADVAAVGEYIHSIKLDLSTNTGTRWTMSIPSHAGDGASVVMADVNGDGFQDVIGATPEGAKGRVEVFHGGPAGPSSMDWQRSGEVAKQRFGSGVRPAGDLNGDGYDDVVVRTVGPAETSTVEVYLGSPTGLASDPIWESPPAWREGTYATGAGDVDGDGFDDLALSSAGALWILYGSSTGLDDRL